jgi:flagellar basal body rod protein FlgG
MPEEEKEKVRAFIDKDGELVFDADLFLVTVDGIKVLKRNDNEYILVYSFKYKF